MSWIRTDVFQRVPRRMYIPKADRSHRCKHVSEAIRVTGTGKSSIRLIGMCTGAVMAPRCPLSLCTTSTIWTLLFSLHIHVRAAAIQSAVGAVSRIKTHTQVKHGLVSSKGITTCLTWRASVSSPRPSVRVPPTHTPTPYIFSRLRVNVGLSEAYIPVSDGPRPRSSRLKSGRTLGMS